MNWDFVSDLMGEDARNTLTTLFIIALILFVTWLVRKSLDTLLPRLIKRFTGRTSILYANRLFHILLPPTRLAVGIVGIWLALLALEPPPQARDIIGRFMASLLAVAIFWALHRAVGLLLELSWRLGRRTVGTESLLAQRQSEKLESAGAQLFKALVIFLGFMVILEQWDYNIGGLVAGLGIGGLAVALAAQDALANLIGYVVILADDPFVVGEYVIIEGIAGTVEKLGFRSTRVRVLDQSLVTIPNKTVVNANVLNWSRLEKRRLNMTLGIEYGNSADRVLSVVQGIREMLGKHDLVDSESVVVQFVEFNSSSLDLMIICFMKTPAWGDFQAAKQDINLRIMRLLDERGVSVAFPSRTVYLQSSGGQHDGAREEAYFPPPKPEPAGGTATNPPVPDDANSR